MANEDKPKRDFTAGIEALASPIYKPVVYPAAIRFVFSCKQCDKAFAIEDGFAIRTAFSEKEVQEMLSLFAKTVEPRTIKCSCGHESVYLQKDVRAYPLESA